MIKRALLLALLCVGSARAQSFPVNSHVTLRLLPDRKVRLLLHGRAWRGRPPSWATLRLLPDSYGNGELEVSHFSDMARLTCASGPARSAQGLATSREEKRSCAWLSEGPQGGCLVIDDITAASWSGPNNLSILS